MKIVFASNNQGKIRELQSLLMPFDLDITPQAEFGVDDIEETGLTFVENAILKARHASLQTGLAAIADDSGLSVPALNGAPGIYSARFAGLPSNSAANIQKLLTAMQDLPESKRHAFFQCVLVYLASAEDPTPLICHGVWHGTILTKSQGTDGFGYDPVFFVPTENKTAAELPLEIKNQLSHRGKALIMLMEKLHEKLI
ncbi:MAG: RdgB/HAM1 family non-canonical purine NTP pyrophosphatase [Gammaproteobacteria bacterium]|nr:RdgB/HAM1 family non-canonical purine NTP pyrophosphatase [Gammaproteobacteria bacterium]